LTIDMFFRLMIDGAAWRAQERPDGGGRAAYEWASTGSPKGMMQVAIYRMDLA
jgi:hypothetical protein